MEQQMESRVSSAYERYVLREELVTDQSKVLILTPVKHLSLSFAIFSNWSCLRFFWNFPWKHKKSKSGNICASMVALCEYDFSLSGNQDGGMKFDSASSMTLWDRHQLEEVNREKWRKKLTEWICKRVACINVGKRYGREDKEWSKGEDPNEKNSAVGILRLLPQRGSNRARGLRWFWQWAVAVDSFI